MENQVLQNAASQQQALTPQGALQNLVFAARQARLSYQEHAVIDSCIELLARVVGPPPGAVPPAGSAPPEAAPKP
jgi:hypothetical protein